MSRYLILHDADCPCPDRGAMPCTTAEEVAVYLSGRFIPAHRIQEGVETYRFGNVPPALLRRVLEQGQAIPVAFLATVHTQRKD